MSETGETGGADAPDERRQRLHRRRFIGAGALGAAGAMATAAAVTVSLSQQEAAVRAAPVTPDPPPAGQAPMRGYLSLSPFQAGVLEAACERLIPADALGPGAKEAGVVFFIDRQLANEQAMFRGPFYRQGPFTPGEPTQGDQSIMTMRERFRIGILGLDGEARARHQQGFADLTGAQQDAILADLEQGKPETFGSASLMAEPATGAPASIADPAPPVVVPAKAFFGLLLAYTQAGFVADPVYGGNLDMAGWKLIGFPGAQLGYAQWIGRHGEAFTGPYQSLADVQGFGHPAHHEEA
ncbi:MAG: gluconate 2-dehydrogenase subunit 3 family protein [Chloroflexota bacterium]